jgi:hypothetical protein
MDDGRFAKDKTWCFCASNYTQRRINQVQGQWFVNNLLHGKKITDIDTLESKLRNNYTRAIEKLQYFTNGVPGSDAYWRDKRAELISINGHHIEVGAGATPLLINF